MKQQTKEGMIILGHCYCQEIDPEIWHEKMQLWEEPRYFYLVTTRMGLHSPLTYTEDISRAMMEAKSKGFLIKLGFLVLLKSGLFRGEIFLELQPPSEQVITGDPSHSCRILQGKFYTVITKAPLTRMGKVIDKLHHDLKKKGEQVQDIYLCLVSCPQCIRNKGPQTVILAHLK